MGKVLGIAWILILIFGCSHGPSAETSNFSLANIQASVEANLSMGIQNYSENHREITSRPFIIRQTEKGQKLGRHERGRAKVTILGDQRPYTLIVNVFIERAKSKGEPNQVEYSVAGEDKGLATKLLKNILSTLEKNTRDKNLIDDFRPF